MLRKIVLINCILIIPSALSQNMDTLFIGKKSPWNAVLRSAILPGMGQFYNESYWKIPIVWGFLGWFGYNWWQNDKFYKDYKSLYLKSIEQNNENILYKRIREFYRDQRDLFGIYFGLTYFLNIVDAYVDAQLFNFDLMTRDDEFYLTIRINLK